MVNSRVVNSVRAKGKLKVSSHIPCIIKSCGDMSPWQLHMLSLCGDPQCASVCSSYSECINATDSSQIKLHVIGAWICRIFPRYLHTSAAKTVKEKICIETGGYSNPSGGADGQWFSNSDPGCLIRRARFVQSSLTSLTFFIFPHWHYCHCYKINSSRRETWEKS